MTLRSWCLRIKNPKPNIKFHQWANSNWPIDRSECALYPSCVIILDSLHRFTTLVTEDCHQRVTYNRLKDTQMELCFKFWLVRGRQTARNFFVTTIMSEICGKGIQTTAAILFAWFWRDNRTSFYVHWLELCRPIVCEGSLRRKPRRRPGIPYTSAVWWERFSLTHLHSTKLQPRSTS